MADGSTYPVRETDNNDIEKFAGNLTFTDSSNLARVEEIARGMGELGMTWSCNAKANVPYETLKVMKANGLRLLLVGYESGDDQILHNIKKGLRTDIARRFTGHCRELGIVIHGTFILGLPGETPETIARTIEFAKQINPLPMTQLVRHCAVVQPCGYQEDSRLCCK